MATYETTTTTAGPGMGPGNAAAPRWINFALGVWLFISAFAWTHTPAASTNTWILGVIIAGIALIASVVPPVRWLNAAAAIWLFASTLVIHHATTGTVWNNIIVAIIVFLLSMIPSGDRWTRSRR